jgi:hypothetical protein
MTPPIDLEKNVRHCIAKKPYQSVAQSHGGFLAMTPVERAPAGDFHFNTYEVCRQPSSNLDLTSRQWQCLGLTLAADYKLQILVESA